MRLVTPRLKEIQRSTLNAQRSTLNDRLEHASTSKIDCSSSARGLFDWTSPYGNHGEVEAAESRKDFIHKLKICLKELKETRRWLRLAAKSAMVSDPKTAAILSETEELIKIFFSSIRTAERNAK